MEVDYRVPFIENWVFFGIMAQIVLIGVVHFRFHGQWSGAFIRRGYSSVLVDKPYDRTSIWLLLLNCCTGAVILMTSLFNGYFFLINSLSNSCIAAFSILLLWHVDYISFWVFSKKSFLEPLLSGNILLYTFGILLLGFNFLHFFKLAKLSLGFITVALFICFFIVRTLLLARRLNTLGFSWYYFILYFCTVYVVPSVLLSKHYSPHWLELLTP